jgi:RimJ/RimL family protein N-acetyltransferase
LIKLISPTINNIPFIDSLWRDNDTMKLIGGPVCLTKEKFQKWFSRMVDPGSATDRYFLITQNQTPVGEASFHRYNAITQTAELNIKIKSEFRGNGIAKIALKKLLAYYFGSFGGEEMFDPVAPKNIPGQNLLSSFGFKLLHKDHEAIVFKLKKSHFYKLYPAMESC